MVWVIIVATSISAMWFYFSVSIDFPALRHRRSFPQEIGIRERPG
jgi:hypothetical protein